MFVSYTHGESKRAVTGRKFSGFHLLCNLQNLGAVPDRVDRG